jgi:hypothetical protein
MHVDQNHKTSKTIGKVAIHEDLVEKNIERTALRDLIILVDYLLSVSIIQFQFEKKSNIVEDITFICCNVHNTLKKGALNNGKLKANTVSATS